MALADPTIVASAPNASAATTTTSTAAADVAQAGPLSDVPLNSWAYDAVDQLAKDGIIKGYPDGTFKGNRPMTRYEAAVLAYRAVDTIESEITAGKAVTAKLRSDMDAANKLIAAFGAELKAVESHVAALQTEADQTKNGLAATQKTVAGQAAQIGALTAFDQKAYIRITDIFTAFAFGANVNSNCGPGAYSGNGGSVATYCHNVGGGTALLQGVKTGGYEPIWGNVPPSGNYANGSRDSGQTFNYFKMSFTGTPSANTAFLVELGDSSRPADSSGRSTQTADCIPENNFLDGNAAQPLSTQYCSIVNASQAAYENGETGFAPGFNNLWIQTQIPNSGIYLRAGHVQNNEGPALGTGFLGGDYYWGGQLGITHGTFNAYVGYGFGNGANTNLVINNDPYPEQAFTAEADNTFKLSKDFSINLGVMYANYTGYSMLAWDPSAVECIGTTAVVAGVGTVGQTRFFANTMAVPFATCGAGFAPVTYASGAPITGYYLGTGNNNPTVSGTLVPGVATASLTAPTANAGMGYITPGLALTTPMSMIAGHINVIDGKWHLYLAGIYHLGNDPYTGSPYVGALAGQAKLDYGPITALPGNAGKWTYEIQGQAIQFNGALPNTNDFGGPILDNSWASNWGGLYWANLIVKYWISDQTNLAIGYGVAGLLPNTVLPASTSTCPGCVVSGYSQPAGYIQMNMSF